MQGLTEDQVEAKLLTDGLNQLTPPRELPQWLKFVKQMFLGFNVLLWISAGLSFLTYGIQFTQMPDPPPDNVRFWALLLCFQIKSKRLLGQPILMVVCFQIKSKGLLGQPILMVLYFQINSKRLLEQPILMVLCFHINSKGLSGQPILMVLCFQIKSEELLGQPILMVLCFQINSKGLLGQPILMVLCFQIKRTFRATDFDGVVFKSNQRDFYGIQF